MNESSVYDNAEEGMKQYQKNLNKISYEIEYRIKEIDENQFIVEKGIGNYYGKNWKEVSFTFSSLEKARKYIKIYREKDKHYPKYHPEKEPDETP